jgi:hypothetical protein
MLMFFRPPSPSVSMAHIARRLVIHKRRLSVLVAALAAAVCLTACGHSPPDDPPLPSGTETTGSYTPSADPYAPSDETSADPYAPSDETTADPYAPSDETTADPYTPSDETNHCAYAGDPLCPDTPVTVPPPDIGNWP